MTPLLTLSLSDPRKSAASVFIRVPFRIEDLLRRKCMPPLSRLVLLVIAPVALAVCGCAEGGHFTVLGYTTQPNYNTDIRTVRVPIFKNDTFRQGLEFDLTRAVIREIEAKTRYQ